MPAAARATNVCAAVMAGIGPGPPSPRPSSIFHIDFLDTGPGPFPIFHIDFLDIGPGPSHRPFSTIAIFHIDFHRGATSLRHLWQAKEINGEAGEKAHTAEMGA